MTETSGQSRRHTPLPKPEYARLVSAATVVIIAFYLVVRAIVWIDLLLHVDIAFQEGDKDQAKRQIVGEMDLRSPVVGGEERSVGVFVNALEALNVLQDPVDSCREWMSTIDISLLDLTDVREMAIRNLARTQEDALEFAREVVLAMFGELRPLPVIIVAAIDGRPVLDERAHPGVVEARWR